MKGGFHKGIEELKGRNKHPSFFTDYFLLYYLGKRRTSV